MGSMGVMEGRSREQIRQKYSDIFKPALIANWKVWPLAQVSKIDTIHLHYCESNMPSTVNQLSVHAATLPCSLPVDLQCLLDSLLVDS